jgi:CP family cyanate transporter-like MFS transporter
VFGLQSLLYFAMAAWVPNVYVERGWSDADAAGLVALLHVVGLITLVAVPLVADRLGSRRSQLVLTSVGTVISAVGFLFLPDLGWLWACFFGLSVGAIFPLALALPVDVSGDAREVGSTAALMLLAGYLASSLGPAVLGFARDLTGDFGASLWILVLLAVALLVSSATLSPARLRRGVSRAPALG